MCGLSWRSEQHRHGPPQLVEAGQQGLGGVVWLLQTGAVAREGGARALAGAGGGGFA